MREPYIPRAFGWLILLLAAPCCLVADVKKALKVAP